MPPPADGFVARLLAGPALRAQSDVRLVKLVREGYESAFEEIVRRYGHPLRHYAAAIVGGSADDVTQDALSKAFLALRRDDRQIELRPWLYRIVRNTALNDLRDRPPRGAELHERIEGQPGVAETVERREEIEELLDRLRALPEAQRAAIVMRELEGLSHGEIATALGISGGAARQAIHRARTALRDGLGMAIPLPLVRLMLDGGGASTAEIAAGGAGAGVVLKAATATVLVAGTLGAGVALHHGTHSASKPAAGASTGNARGPGRLATTFGEISPTTHRGAEEGSQPDRGDRGNDRRGGSSRPNEGDHGGGEPVRSGSHDSSGPSGEQTHHGGGDSGSATSGSGRSGDGDASSGDGSSDDGGDSASESSGSSSSGQGGDEISTLEGDSGSNSGPDSGGEEDSPSTESSGSRDSSASDGFSG